MTERLTKSEWVAAERWIWYGRHMGVPEWQLRGYALRKIGDARREAKQNPALYQERGVIVRRLCRSSC